MNDQFFSNEIFFEPQGSNYAGEEASFLDISQYLFGEPLHQKSHSPFLMEESPQLQVEDLFQQTPMRDQTSVSLVREPKEEPIKQKPKKKLYDSSYNKNVCYNICQKTAKFIEKGTYGQKVAELCDENEVDEEKFKSHISRQKRNLTGPKALTVFASENNPLNKVFVSFMKWFLTEKYLRIALNEGEMKNVKAYIEYKNLVILPLLD